MKPAVILLSFILSAFSNTFASSQEVRSSEAQLERLEGLKVGRAPTAAFPELMDQLTQNANVIRARLSESLHAPFDAARQEIEVACGRDLTLYKFNMAHYVWAMFLTSSQRQSPLSSWDVETYLGYLKDCASVPLQAPYAADTPVHMMASAAGFGLYPYTAMNETGVFSLDTLNGSFAARAPFCGLPLSVSSFDGGQDEDARAFLDHDWRHVYFNRGIAPFASFLLAPAYGAYTQMYKSVQAVPDPKQRAGDQLVLFFMMHEGSSTLLNDMCSIENGVATVLPTFRFDASCAFTKNALGDFVENVQEPFGEQAIGVLQLEIAPTYQDKSVVDVMRLYHQDKSVPLDWKKVVRPLGVAKTLREDGREFTGELGFDAYNILYDLQGACQDAGVHFVIWSEDGTFNAHGMIETLGALVNGFQARHAYSGAESS
ncbi:MAG: hypothetical protein C0514_07400 [Candidatus Puniceispirillum sp.]|nr:hypothetical protein [Candidatus Puniceispirillum sp.]